MLNKKFSLNEIDFNIAYPESLNSIAKYYVINTTLSNANLQINSSIYFQDSNKINLQGNKISNNLWLLDDNTVVYIFNNQLHIKIVRTDSRNISTIVCINSSESLRSRIKRSINRHENWFTVICVQAMRHALLYPYFFLMQQNFGAMLSHGAAFSINNKGICVVGFDGIGKSSIAHEALNKGANILTDNFLLFDEKFIYFVPDPLRIQSKEEGIFWGKKLMKLQYVTSKVVNTAVIFTYLGSCYSLRKSPASEFLGKNRLILNFLPEFYDINRYATAISLAQNELISSDRDIPLNINYFECERATKDHNMRLITDVLSI